MKTAATRLSTCLLVPIVLALATYAAVPALAQGSASPSPRIIEDRTDGEGDKHQRRAEWFFSSRKAGTSADGEMAALRRLAVEDTREAIKLQRQQRADRGLRNPTNGLWFSRGPSPSNFGSWTFGKISGRISAIAANWLTETLYLGTASGGLWASTDDGQTWTQIFDKAGTQTIGTVATDPVNPSILWVGTGENHRYCESYFGIGLLRSDDGGTTWELRNGSGGTSLEGLASFASILIDPRDRDKMVTGGKFAGCDSGSEHSGALYTSDDAGLSWTNRLPNTEIHEIARDPAVLDILWAATSRGIYKSTDNGQSWSLQNASGLPTGSFIGRTELAIAPSDGNTVYALFSTSGGSLWRTTDGGATWSQRATGSDACDGQCSYNMVLRVHRSDPDTVYRGTIRLYKSTDGGANWTDLINSWGNTQRVHQDIHTLLMSPLDDDVFYVGGDGGLWKSSSGGAGFSNRNGNLNITQFYAVDVDAQNTDTICGGSQDNSSLVRTNSDTWDLQLITGDGFVCQINPWTSSFSFVASYPQDGRPKVYRSDSGVLGEYDLITGASNGIVGGESSNWVTPYLLDPTHPSEVYLGTQRVYKSANHGSQWTPQDPSNMCGSGSLQSLEINRVHPDYLFAGCQSGRVWRTENEGTDWTEITTGLPSRSINDIAGDPLDPDRAFAVVGGFNTPHLWEWTEESGWTARGDDLPNVPANTVVLASTNDIFVGMDTGVFRSQDGGVTFEPYMDGMPEGVVVTDLKLTLPDNLLTAGTYGRGAWQAVIDPAASNLRFASMGGFPNQIDGDGDFSVEPGETWSIRPRLQNVGGQTALSATARLSTSTPGVMILDEDPAGYGDVDIGEVASPAPAFRFAIDPGFPCGEDVVFDVVEIRSDDLPGVHADQLAVLTVTVVDSFAEPMTSGPVTQLDLGAGSGWSPSSNGTEHSVAYRVGDSTDGGHSWLHLGGLDSQGAPGIEIPQEILAARLVLEHSYDTAAGRGRVVIDATADGRDEFKPLHPDGERRDAQGGFQGLSSGSVTSTFDLSRYRGKQVRLAFVYEHDAALEGDTIRWTVDSAGVQYLRQGAAVCHVTQWPGTVPTTAHFSLDGSEIEATWSDSCNALEYPGQAYSIHAGDLDVLAAGGGYSHAPVGDLCELFTGATFAPGPGNEYYLVVPSADGREGGYGEDSDGVPRPQASGECGLLRIGECL